MGKNRLKITKVDRMGYRRGMDDHEKSKRRVGVRYREREEKLLRLKGWKE